LYNQISSDSHHKYLNIDSRVLIPFSPLSLCDKRGDFVTTIKTRLGRSWKKYKNIVAIDCLLGYELRIIYYRVCPVPRSFTIFPIWPCSRCFAINVEEAKVLTAHIIFGGTRLGRRNFTQCLRLKKKLVAVKYNIIFDSFFSVENRGTIENY
jgi:hypothetical protein